MKRTIALLSLAAVLLVPHVGFGAVIQTFFPAGSDLYLENWTSSSFDGVNHAVFAIRTDTLDIYFAQLTPSGAPRPPAGLLYGKVTNVQQTGPNSFLVTWSVSVSAGGLSQPFFPAGTISVPLVF